jgi:putative addiction module killer protein
VEIVPYEIRYYQTLSRRRPFQDWLETLEAKPQQIVLARLARVRRGLLGDAKPVGGGVHEFRIDVGPRDRGTVVLLLHGGEKGSQSADIMTARDFWRDYLERTKK